MTDTRIYNTGIDYRVRLLHDYYNLIVFWIISYLHKVYEPHSRRHLGEREPRMRMRGCVQKSVQRKRRSPPF